MVTASKRIKLNAVYVHVVASGMLIAKLRRVSHLPNPRLRINAQYARHRAFVT